MEERDFANAAQPDTFDSAVMTFNLSGRVPISLWNRVEVEETPNMKLEAEEPLFGTHLKEAIEAIKGLRKA